MHPYKEQMAMNISNIVANTSTILSNQKDINSSIQALFKINDETLHNVLKRIVNGLPEKYLANKAVENHINELIAKEFILFQCQEDYSNKNYEQLLANFIYDIVREIDAKFFKEAKKS